MHSNILRGKWKNAKLYLVRVTGSSGALSGPDASSFTVVKNGTGDYSLTAVTAFAEIPYVSAQSETADVSLLQVLPTTTVIRVKGRSVAASPAAAAATMQLFIYGVPLDAATTVGNNNMVRSIWKNSRMMTLTATDSGTLTLSGPDAALFTAVDTGTGIYTLTAATAFAEPPFCAVTTLTADTSNYQTAPTSTVLVLKGRTVGASPAANDNTMDVIVFGPELLSADPDRTNP